MKVSQPISAQNKLIHRDSTAHRYLHDRVGILHRDLSANNVLLNRKDNEFEATGLLIDYDYSLVVDSNHQILCHTQAGSTANASSTHAAEDISIGERAVVMNTDIPSDTSEGNVAVGAEKAQSEIRTVRSAHLLKCQVLMIL